MSKKKYVIEPAFEDMSIQKIMQLGLDDNGRITNWTDSIEDVEELNSDYINENFGELQDEAYRKGFEDGKNSIDMGCEGCRYSLRFAKDEPCKSCSNCYKSKYEPMPKEDDRIEVGDEVIAPCGKAVVTALHNNSADYLYSDGDCGCTELENLTKTGKHYDIQSILEAMRT